MTIGVLLQQTPVGDTYFERIYKVWIVCEESVWRVFSIWRCVFGLIKCCGLTGSMLILKSVLQGCPFPRGGVCCEWKGSVCVSIVSAIYIMRKVKCVSPLFEMSN
jgi:hypothetical protein